MKGELEIKYLEDYINTESLKNVAIDEYLPTLRKGLSESADEETDRSGVPLFIDTQVKEIMEDLHLMYQNYRETRVDYYRLKELVEKLK